MGKRRSATKKNTNGAVVEKPGRVDVLFGRGGHVNHHPANQEYLKLVTSRKEEYYNCEKTQKSKIAWDIIRQLREREPRMRFLRKEYNTNHWHVVDDTEVRRKISQCLRERGTPVCPTAKSKSKGNNKGVVSTAATDATVCSKKKVTKTTTATSSTTSNSTTRPLLRNRGKTNTTSYAESDEDEWLPDDEEVTYPARVVTRSSSGGSRQESVGVGYEEEEEDDEVEEQGLPENPHYDDGHDEVSSETAHEEEVENYEASSAATGNESIASMEDPVPVLSTSTSTSNHQVCVVAPPSPPPPMPARVPLKQPDGSNRVWSDFFSRSFASFAPSIFDYSSGNPENAWENLLDPSILPELATSEDEQSFPEDSGDNMDPHPILPTSTTSGTFVAPPPPPSSSARTYSQVSIGNPSGWGECISSPATKRRKTAHVPLPVYDEDVETDPLSLFL